MNEAPPQDPAAAPPVAPPVAPTLKELIRFENEKKSAGVAFLLCWLCGNFGGHRFYLGRPHAATMLLITLISIPLCFVLIGFAGLLATWIWMFVDLLQVVRWTKEHNTALFSKIHAELG